MTFEASTTVFAMFILWLNGFEIKLERDFWEQGDRTIFRLVCGYTA